MKGSTKISLAAFGALGVILAAGLLWPMSHRRIHSLVTLEMAHAVWMRTAIWHYAQTHEDAFPKSLGDLDLGAIPPEARHFHDPRSTKEEDWSYYPGHGLASPPETIILASPQKVDSHRRIVIFADGSGQIMEESEFTGRLSRQLHGE